MGEDKIQKFVEHMRAAGQSDDMIAQSLIDAGNNELVVMNALNVSSIDELEPEEETPEQSEIAAPIVDSNGNLVFGTPENIAETPAPSAPVERKPIERDYPKPAARQTRPEREPKSEVQPAHKLAPDTNNKPLDATEHDDSHTEPKTPVLMRTAAPSASQLHKLGVTPTPVERTHNPSLKLNNNAVNEAAEHDTESRHAVAKPPADTPHSHHHKPHSFDETMEDLTDHKEIEPGSEHELDSGEIEPVKRMETKTDPVVKEAPQIIEPEEVKLPQEIKVDELEKIDEQDTHELKEAAKDVGKEVEEINTPSKQPEPVMPSSPEIKKVADTANAIRSSLALRIVLIGCVVLIIISLAVSVATKITG